MLASSCFVLFLVLFKNLFFSVYLKIESALLHFCRSDEINFRCVLTILGGLLDFCSLLRTYRDYGNLLRGVFEVLHDGRFLSADNVDNNMKYTNYEEHTRSVKNINFLLYNLKRKIFHAAIN